MKSPIEQIEDRLKKLIERSIALFAPNKNQKMLMDDLISVLKDYAEQENITQTAITFEIRSNPSDINQWSQESGWVEWLAEAIYNTSLEENIQLLCRPVIQFFPDRQIKEGSFKIRVVPARNSLGDTEVIPANSSEGIPDPGHEPSSAFLIIDGSKFIYLTQQVTNLGRKEDNHVVINDPKVSRSHAQIRCIAGKYVIFDLDSTGGTFVNGDRIFQASLHPGDVISLAGVPLVYGEEKTLPNVISGETAEIESKRE